jgi:hypothetical protein
MVGAVRVGAQAQDPAKVPGSLLESAKVRVWAQDSATARALLPEPAKVEGSLQGPAHVRDQEQMPEEDSKEDSAQIRLIRAGQ